jgi:hypothetical protein
MSVTTEATDVRQVPSSRVASPSRHDRLFFSGMAIAAALTVLAGFAPTYYLKSYFGSPALSSLLHLHGALFTSWIVFFVVQTALVASRRTRVHRRIGAAGGALAGVMVVVGTMAAIDAARRGAAPTGVPSLAFLAIPLADMVMFALLVGTGLYFRNRSDIHKRLMLLGTIGLLTAAIARLPFDIIRSGNPVVFFGLSDLFVLACFAYDLATRRRVHPAFLWGGLALVASQVARVMLAGTDAWMRFAGWLTGA